MQAGFTRYDSAFAGVGGCPFVPGAAGNVATEDVLACVDSPSIYEVPLGLHEQRFDEMVLDRLCLERRSADLAPALVLGAADACDERWTWRGGSST